VTAGRLRGEGAVLAGLTPCPAMAVDVGARSEFDRRAQPAPRRVRPL
jgi:hypothetical protein